MQDQHNTIQSNALNLFRLIWLRFIVIVGEGAAISYAINILHIELPLRELVYLLTGFSLINLLSLFRIRFHNPVSNLELFTQFIIDVIALTIFLYLTGGSTNPFAPLYLLPLILTAATLPGLFTWGMVIITIGFYSLLLFYYVDLPAMHGSHDHGFRLHVLGMWLGFVLSALLIAGFVVSMSNTVKRQNKKIADLREQQLKHEQVLALGTLATGAAHELGTPLSTMAILLKDLEAGDTLQEDELTMLRKQVDRCREILGSITASAGTTRAISGSEVTLDKHFESLLSNWRESRPNIQPVIAINGPIPAPSIVADQTLDQAILNILNNAADASPDDIEIRINWDNQQLILEVADRGTGLLPDAIGKTGDSIYTSKQDGLGLGLFLTFTTLERLGGQISLHNRDGGGVICKLNLPLNAILISATHG